MWEQLHLAYRYGVQQVWMVNVGDLKNAEHPKKAQEFLAYILSDEGQKVLETSGSKEYSVAKGATSDPDLPTLESLEAPAIDPVDLDSEKVTQMMTDAGIL